MTAPTSRFAAKLQEQLGFIHRSCVAFDGGHEDEAFRLAVALRVIFHDTGASISLTSHLGLKSAMMLSSSRGHRNFQDYLSYRLDLSSPIPVHALPLLGDQFKELPMAEWWSKEPVFVHGGKSYSRRIIVLSAANKDGGAHVDDELEEYYKVLCAGEYAFGVTGNLTYRGAVPFQHGVTHYAKNAHLALIRQFAHEADRSVSRFRLPV